MQCCVFWQRDIAIDWAARHGCLEAVRPLYETSVSDDDGGYSYDDDDDGDDDDNNNESDTDDDGEDDEDDDSDIDYDSQDDDDDSDTDDDNDNADDDCVDDGTASQEEHTAIFWATIQGQDQLEPIRCLHEAAVYDHDDNYNYSNGDVAVLQQGDTAIYWAARQGHLEAIRCLHEAGVSLDSQNKVGTQLNFVHCVHLCPDRHI